MAVDAEWHHSRSSDLSSTPQLSEYGVIGCASTEAPSNNCLTLTLMIWVFLEANASLVVGMSVRQSVSLLLLLLSVLFFISSIKLCQVKFYKVM